MRRIINTYDQMMAYGGDRVAITYNAQWGRSPIPSAWLVWRIVDGKTVPTAKDWHYNDKKPFMPHGRADRMAKLAEAKAWVAEHYGERDFVRNRMGDYVEREVNAKYPLPKREKA